MSKEKQFTPGPWSSSPQNGIPGHCFVAQVWRPDDKSLARIEPTEPPEEASANARLIAAAPEMYELLERIADQCDDYLAPLSDEAKSILNKINNEQ